MDDKKRFGSGSGPMLEDSERVDQIVLMENRFIATNVKTSGKSPSYQAQKDGVTFQIKKPGMTVWYRNTSGYDTNISDMLGEFVASKVGAAMMNTIGGLELVPEVSLVKGADGYVKLASKYLNYGVPGVESITVDQLAEKKTPKS
jgi:hypothetical protein